MKEGWRGRLFEYFEVGDVYEHPLSRTVIAADNVWFTLLTQNTAPVDKEMTRIIDRTWNLENAGDVRDLLDAGRRDG